MSRLLLAVPRKHSLDALYPPVGLLYLAAAARENGHYVRVLDGQVDGDEAILQELEAGRYDFFGTTVLSALRHHSYELIRKVRQVRPECCILAGGAHISLLPEQTMQHVREIDIGVVGEGEATLAEILSGKPLAEIQGIWYRFGGQLCRTAPRPPLPPDRIPMPAWDLIDVTPYRAFEHVIVEGVDLSQKPMLTIYSSRGCTGHCTFCSTWWIWKCWRQVPAGRFVDEIEVLYRRGIEHFFFADDSMLDTSDFADQFFAEIARRGLRIHFKIACRADKVMARNAAALKKAGCYEAHIGFESGSQRILDAMKKDITVEENIRAADILHEAGIRVYALLVIGHIDEDTASINATIDFIDRIRPDAMASMDGLMLMPGTVDYERAKREGLVSDDFWLDAEPYPVYTGTFSQPELHLIWAMIDRRRKLWGRRLLHVQAALCMPGTYRAIIQPRGVLGFALRAGARLRRLLARLARRTAAA